MVIGEGQDLKEEINEGERQKDKELKILI